MSMISISKITNIKQSEKNFYGFYKECYPILFKTIGKLNKNKDNVILAHHPLSYDINITGKNGWWNDIVGSGKAIDTTKYFVIITSFDITIDYYLCQESSHNINHTSVSLEWLSQYQDNILNYFQIMNLHASIGGSFGGVSALSHAVLSKKTIKNLVLISSTHKTYPNHLILYKIIESQTQKDITSLDMMRILLLYNYRKSDLFNHKLKNNASTVDIYINRCIDKLPKINPNIFLYLIGLLSDFCFSDKLSKINSNILLIGSSSDSFYTTEQITSFHNHLMLNNKNSTLKIVSSQKGHDAFLLEQAKFGHYINEFI